MQPIRVLVVEDDRGLRDIIRSLMDLENWIIPVGFASDIDEAISMALQSAPDVILSDFYLPGGTGAEVAERLSAVLPHVPIIMMSVESASDVMRSAIRAGAKDFLVKPFGPNDLYNALQRVSTRSAASEPELEEDSAPPQGAEIVAVHSPKGGCGVTTIACNLAVAKRLETGARVAVVDLSLAYGGVGLMMDLNNSTNIYELSLKLDELDAALLNDILVTHPSGVKALLAPPHPQQAESISGLQVRQILQTMSEHFDYIFIDTAHDVSEITLVALDLARTVIVVGAQDVAAVRDVKLFTEVAELLGYPMEKVRLVLNRVNSYTPLATNAIQARLSLVAAGLVPEELKLFAEASSRGIPVVIASRSSLAAREIRKVAMSITAQQLSEELEVTVAAGTSKPGRRSLFARARA